MNIENTKAQMRKGILEFCILSLIKRREMYVLDLMEELKKADMEVVAGYIDEVINHANDEKLLENIAKKVNEFMHGRPLFND